MLFNMASTKACDIGYVLLYLPQENQALHMLPPKFSIVRRVFCHSKRTGLVSDPPVTTTGGSSPLVIHQCILMESIDWNLADSVYQGVQMEKVDSIPSNDYAKLPGTCTPGNPSASALDIMQSISNASRGPAFRVAVCIGIFQAISRTHARCTGMLRRARFLDVARLSGVHGICLEFG